MALTTEELNEQLELQNRTITELKDANAKITADLATAQAAKAPAADATALQKQLADLAAKLEPVAKENEQLKAQLTVTNLRIKYPDVDPSLIPAGAADAMDAFAAKIQALVNTTRAKAAPPPPAGPGQRFANMPPMGGVSLDVSQRAEAEAKNKSTIAAAVKSGDAKATLDAILESKPGALRTLFQASADPNFVGNVPAQV